MWQVELIEGNPLSEADVAVLVFDLTDMRTHKTITKVAREVHAHDKLEQKTIVLGHKADATGKMMHAKHDRVPGDCG